MIPMLKRGPSLGQFSSSIIEEAARKVIQEAGPLARKIVAEERSKVANAMKGALPFAGLSAAALLGTRYLVPASSTTGKMAGYVASAALLGVGAWRVLDELSAEMPAPTPAAGDNVLTSLIKPTADQLAKSVVTEAEPKVREIIRDEKAKFAEAAMSGLPWAGASAAAALGTAFLVPESQSVAKLAGYGAATALLLGGIWSGLGKVAS